MDVSGANDDGDDDDGEAVGKRKRPTSLSGHGRGNAREILDRLVANNLRSCESDLADGSAPNPESAGGTGFCSKSGLSSNAAGRVGEGDKIGKCEKVGHGEKVEQGKLLNNPTIGNMMAPASE